MTFQHTAARRRLGFFSIFMVRCAGFNTQPPEGGWRRYAATAGRFGVSTHSRPKAAGYRKFAALCRSFSFNTQPPEGGWGDYGLNVYREDGFNTQPPEGGWKIALKDITETWWFQHTAARRRLVNRKFSGIKLGMVSTHSRPKAAGICCQ